MHIVIIVQILELEGEERGRRKVETKGVETEIEMEIESVLTLRKKRKRQKRKKSGQYTANQQPATDHQKTTTSHNRLGLDIKKRPFRINSLLLLLLLGERVMWTSPRPLRHDLPPSIGVSVPTPNKPTSVLLYPKEVKEIRTSKHRYSQTYPAHHPDWRTTQPNAPRSRPALSSS